MTPPPKRSLAFLICRYWSLRRACAFATSSAEAFTENLNRLRSCKLFGFRAWSVSMMGRVTSLPSELPLISTSVTDTSAITAPFSSRGMSFRLQRERNIRQGIGLHRNTQLVGGQLFCIEVNIVCFVGVIDFSAPVSVRRAPAVCRLPSFDSSYQIRELFLLAPTAQHHCPS